MIYKDLGIPLRASNVGEADKIYTILTKTNGKIQSVAKGVRKIQSRKRGNIEIGTLSSLTLYKGRTLYTLTECEMLDYFEHIRDFIGIKFIFEILRICDKFANTQQSCEFLFDHSVSTLKIADQYPGKLSVIKPWFRLHVAQFESTFEENPQLDERFQLLLKIFLNKSLEDIFRVNITSQTLERLESYSINSLSIK